MTRLCSLGIWSFSSLAIALAVLVPLTVPEDAFADGGTDCNSVCNGNPTCVACCEACNGDQNCIVQCAQEIAPGNVCWCEFAGDPDAFCDGAPKCPYGCASDADCP